MVTAGRKLPPSGAIECIVKSVLAEDVCAEPRLSKLFVLLRWQRAELAGMSLPLASAVPGLANAAWIFGVKPRACPWEEAKELAQQLWAALPSRSVVRARVAFDGGNVKFFLKAKSEAGAIKICQERVWLMFSFS